MSSRLAVIGSAFSRVESFYAHDEIDLLDVARVDRLEHRLRNLAIHGVLIVAPDMSDADVAPLSAAFEFPTLPFIFCGKIARELAAFVKALSRYANPRLFLEHYEDVQGVTQFINERSPTREQRLFRAAIEDTMARLPTRVRLNLELGLRELPVRNAVETLAARAGRSERWVFGQMHAAGFVNAHSVFLGQRLIDAWWFARDGGYHNVDIARKSSYATMDGLLHLMKCIGVKAVADLAALSPEEVVAQVIGKVLRS